VNEAESPRTPFRTKLIAVVVLALCAWILLKLVIGLIAGLATIIVIVGAVVGILWAVSKF